MVKLQPGVLVSFFDSLKDLLRELATKLTAITAAVTPASAAFGSVQTNATGTNWTTLTSSTAKRVTLLNETGTDIDIRLNGAGTTITVSDNQGIELGGLTNANQIGVRRVDTSNTQVTLKYVVN